MKTVLLAIVSLLLINASYSQAIRTDSLPLKQIQPAKAVNKSEQTLLHTYISPKNKTIINGKASDAATVTSNVVDNSTVVTRSVLQNIEVYPNPTHDNIKISFGSAAYDIAAVEIANTVGESVFSSKYQNILVVTIDLSNKPKGIYLLSVVIDAERIIKKVIVE